MSELRLTLGPDALERIAERAAEIVLDRLREQQASSWRWLCGAKAIADYLGWTRGAVYKRAHEMPVHRVGVGLGLAARTDELDRWLAVR
jgi:hypothetical protein